MKTFTKSTVATVFCFIFFMAGCAALQQRPATIQRGEVVFLGKGSVQEVRQIKMKSVDFAIRAQAGTILPIAPPKWYPRDLSWRPLRHFGPFFSGSDITQIHFKLNAKIANWYYNNFFTGHEDAEIFQKYYGSSLPANTPTTNIVPGTFPDSDGFNDTMLALQRVSYSSRYGGAVQLKFKTFEDYEVEVRNGTTLWDITTLEMNVYVVPIAGWFNPNYPLSSGGRTYIEFEPHGVVAYELVSNNLIVLPDSNLTDLDSALREIAVQMLTSTFAREAHRFIHGFSHSQFKDYIGPTDKVDWVEITDDFFNPHTREGEVVFTFSVRISDINLDTEPGDEEIKVTIAAQHMFDTINQAQNPIVSHEFREINNREGTYFRNFGIFKLQECDALQAVIFSISVVEDDDFPNPDDRFDTTFHQIAFNCSNLTSRADDGSFGLVSENTTEGVLLMDDDNVEGALTFVTRVSLLLL